MVEKSPAADRGSAAEELPLSDDYAGPRNLAVHKVRSSAGTSIAYEISGSGPPVVVIGGGLNDRAMFTPFATLMSENFTVYNYDRRGRGDSDYGDPDSYTIDREVEDLAAVIEAAGESTHVFANCTGGMIAIHAAAAGVPMKKMAIYEPPYACSQPSDAQLAVLRRYITDNRRADAVTLFGKDIVGFMTEETLDRFKQHPAWNAFEAMAPSTIYDAIISADNSAIPYTLLPKVTVPTLVMMGLESIQPILDSCKILAKEIPGAQLLAMEGHGHLVNQQACAPLVDHYFQS